MGIAQGVSADEIDAIGEAPLDGAPDRQLPSAALRSAIIALTKLSSLVVGFRHIAVMHSPRRRSAIGVEFAGHNPPLRASGIGAKPAFGPADDVRSIALLVIGPDGDPDVPPNGDQAADPRIYCARGGDLGVAESRDYLFREGVEVFEPNVEGGAERRCADDQVEARKRLSTGFS
jgi:hypothetical protein